MKIVQTFWSGGGDILKDSFGWYSSQHHLLAWALSCLELKNYYEDVELYTDKNGYEVLINQLKLPYTKVWVVLDDLQKYPKELWGLAKVKTYSLQNGPFIHIDSDVFIWSAFGDSFHQSSLVAQNFEKGTDYYNNKFKEVKKYLKYIPGHFNIDINDKAVCSCNAGVIGGKDFNFFKKYAAYVFDFVDGNDLNGIPGHVLTNFNILFEQVLFYELSQKEGKLITCLFDRTIDDCGYKYDEIADFTSVPYVNTYLHLIGPNKRNETACDLMSRVLLKEYPEYFFKTISLYKEPYRHSNFSSFEETEKEKVKSIALQFKNEQISEGVPYKTISEPSKCITPVTALLIKAFGLQEGLADINSNTIEDISHKNFLMEEALTYENNVKEILEEFDKISNDYLLARDICSVQYFDFFHSPREVQLKKVLIKDPLVKTIDTVYDWTSLRLKNMKFETETKAAAGDSVTIACIPELFFSAYREVLIEDLDYNILVALEKATPFGDLLKRLEECFDEEDIKTNYDNFYELIMLKIKSLVYNKCIRVKDN
jgi:hypothetical protein